MTVTQQQRTGAQRVAAGRVREQRAVFDRDLAAVLSEAQSLRATYQGPAATAFFALVGQWLDDAGAIVRDLEGFAERMDRQEVDVAAQQEASASGFTRAGHRLATRF
ncbi:WXG100 family type VII secretion target [Lapillicoccus jejuensis]|uniref:Uncharacterized protein n=1 Tax=Lapillicoccus jejuensis TaxID=402171 RepID=A0A542E0G4_9MICO|nr:hypothetical protein [Lapillicoccus jejuensis]TQJ08833.1 hypothetical protein FB458_1930 [Lapillicoccus jejuensis]